MYLVCIFRDTTELETQPASKDQVSGKYSMSETSSIIGQKRDAQKIHKKLLHIKTIY